MFFGGVFDGHEGNENSPDSAKPVVAVSEEPATEEPEPASEEVKEVQFSEEQARTMIYAAVFESKRAGFIEIFRDMSVIKSVDSYVYAPETGTVMLDVTSEYSSEGRLHDDAWELKRLFGNSMYSEVNDAGDWLLDNARLAPALRFTVSS